MVKLLKTDGGIIITSSHNPIEWNGIINFENQLIEKSEPQSFISFLGLKFVDRDSLFLAPAGCTEMFKLADATAFSFPSYQKMGTQKKEGKKKRKRKRKRRRRR